MKIFNILLSAILFLFINIYTVSADQPDALSLHDSIEDCKVTDAVMEVYPNPLAGSTGYIVMNDNTSGVFNIQMTNPYTRNIVFSQQVEVKKDDLTIHIPLSGVSEGIYIIKLTDENGCHWMQRVMKR